MHRPKIIVLMVLTAAGIVFTPAGSAGEYTGPGGWVPLNGGGYVSITVTDDAGVERADELARGGVPFARGQVAGIDRLQVRDGAGAVVPFQSRPLAWWDDGSVKWALAAFRISLPAGGRRAYRLVVLPDPTNEPEQGVLVEQHGSIVSLDTGRLRTSFNTGAFRLFEGIDVRDAAGAWRKVGEPADDALYLTVLRRESPRIGEHWHAPAGEGGETIRLVSAGSAEFSIEDSGPLFTTLRFAGRFHPEGDPHSEMGGKFILRVTAFAGSPELELKHTFIYTGIPTRDFVRAMGVRLRPAFDARRALFDGSEIVARELDRDRTIVAVQVDEDRLNLDGSPETARPTGAGAVQGSDLSIAAFVRDFWRHYPKGMSLSREVVDIGLWPEAAGRVLDLRRTVGDDEPNIQSADRAASAQGLAKTHDILLSFKETSGGDELRRRATAFNRTLLPVAAPEYMCGTGVEGHIYAVDFDNFPRTEALGDIGWRWLLAAQDRFGWYGFVDYGSVRTNYNRGQGRWRDTGRYGWREIPEGLGLMYFRSGNRDLYDFFIHQVEHNRDIDVVHYADDEQPHPVGTMHRRNKDHWSGAATAHYTKPRGMGLAYFLTGDPRTLEVLLSTANHIDDVNMVTSFARSYEATGDPDLRKGLLERVARFIGSPPERPYHSFRFTSDYFRALAQYIRVMPDDETALDTIVEQARWWSHPDRWFRYYYAYGYYELFAFALAHSVAPDPDRFVFHPSLAVTAQAYDGPTEGYEGAAFDELDGWVRTNASLTVGWYLDFYPYGIAAMADLGITEQDIIDRREAAPFISGLARYATKVQPGRGEEAGHTALRLPGPNWSGDRPLRVSDPDGRHRFEPGFERLPWGARLKLSGVPFELAAREEGFIVLGSEPVVVPVGMEAGRIHLLGLVATRANWRRGDLGAILRIVFADGEVNDRPLRNMIDYEDITMWKFSGATELARYVGYGRPYPRTHLNILTLETGGRRIESIKLIPGDIDDGLCLLAVTAETNEPFAPGGILYSFGPEPVEGALHAGAAAYAPETGYGWSSRVRGQETGANIGRGSDFLVEGLQPGRYRVTAALRTLQARSGGLLDILAGGRRLRGVAIAANADDEISFVAETPDGRLRIGFHPGPRDIGGSWSVAWLRVEPTAEEPAAEAFEDPIADLRPLRSLSFEAEATSDQGWFDGYDSTRPHFAIDGRFDTAFGLPRGEREVHLVLTFPGSVTADAARLLVCEQIDEEFSSFGLALEAEIDGNWVRISNAPRRIEALDYVFRFTPTGAERFRLLITDGRRDRPRHTPRIRELQFFDTLAGNPNGTRDAPPEGLDRE